MEVGTEQVYEIATGTGKVIVRSKVTEDHKGQKLKLFEVVRIKWRTDTETEFPEEVLSRHWTETAAIKVAKNLTNVYVPPVMGPPPLTATCLNNLGLEDRFDIGASYPMKVLADHEFLLMTDKHGKKSEVFRERFRFDDPLATPTPPFTDDPEPEPPNFVDDPDAELPKSSEELEGTCAECVHYRAQKSGLGVCSLDRLPHLNDSTCPKHQAYVHYPTDNDDGYP